MDRAEWVTLLYGDNLDQSLRAVSVLAEQHDSHVVSTLMNRISDAPVPLTLAIIDTLIEFKDARAIPAMVSCIRHDSEDVRGEALYGIIALSQERSKVMPEELMRNEDPLRPSRALTQIVYPADMEAVKLLHTHLTDSDPEVRIAASYGLGCMGAINAAHKLQELASSDTDGDVQSAAAYALGQLVDHGATDCLDMLTNLAAATKNTEALIAATRTLITYRPKAHLNVFSRCLQHEDERVRQLGIIGIGRSNDLTQRDVLLNSLDDASPHVKRLAVHALGQLGCESSIQTLVMKGRSASSELRMTISSSLSVLPRKAVVSVLLNTAMASDWSTRSITAYLAAKLNCADLVVSLLKDPEELVRKQATLGLADLVGQSETDIVKAAQNALKDSSWKVRVAGIEVMRRLGNQEAINALGQLSDDPNHVVRQAIRRTLNTF